MTLLPEPGGLSWVPDKEEIQNILDHTRILNYVILIKSMSSDVFDEMPPHKTRDYVKLHVNQCHPRISPFLIKSYFT